MENVNVKNCDNVIEAANELLESGVLWISLAGEDFYVPDVIADIRKLKDYTQSLT